MQALPTQFESSILDHFRRSTGDGELPKTSQPLHPDPIVKSLPRIRQVAGPKTSSAGWKGWRLSSWVRQSENGCRHEILTPPLSDDPKIRFAKNLKVGKEAAKTKLLEQVSNRRSLFRTHPKPVSARPNARKHPQKPPLLDVVIVRGGVLMGFPEKEPLSRMPRTIVSYWLGSRRCQPNWWYGG